MKPLSGNSSDPTDFGQIVRDHLAQVQITYGKTYLVADSALYRADNLQKLSETGTKWITRVPATLSEAQAALAQADPETMSALPEGYHAHVLASTYGGVAQRWVLIDSAPRRPQAQHTVTSTGSSRVRKTRKPSRSCAAQHLPVKPMHSRP